MLVGKNGNILVDYKWIWTWGEKWSDSEGGMVSAKVTDKEATPENCSVCGRNIWHVYYIKDIETKEVKAYGKEHVYEALGYSKPLKSTKIDQMVMELNAKKRDEEIYRAQMEKYLKHCIVSCGLGWENGANQANCIFRDTFGISAIKGSFFMQNENGDIVRSSEKNRKFYEELGFEQTSEPV